MGEVMTLLTSATGHVLVKNFRGEELSQQPFYTATLYTPWTESEVHSHLATGWGEGAISDLKLEYLYGPEPEVSGDCHYFVHLLSFSNLQREYRYRCQTIPI